MTDWSKVFEVFGSGILGVYLVMFLLQLLTQLSTRIIDRIESNGKAGEARTEPAAGDTAGKA
jgi:hypothetical protein